MTLKRILTAAAVVLGSVTAVTVIAPQVASAHHPVISATPSRPCGSGQPWSVSFTANQDGNYGPYQWRSKHRWDLGNNGSWEQDWTAYSAFVDDSVTYGPKTIADIPASVASVNIEVLSQWYNNGSFVTQDTRNKVVYRPNESTCPAPTPTVSGTAVCATSGDGSWQTTWTVTRPGGAPNSWRVYNPGGYSPAYPGSYGTNATVSRTQTFSAATAQSPVETVKAQYEQGAAVSAEASAGPITAPTGCAHPPCANRIEVAVNAATYTIPDPADYGYAAWSEIWSKSGANPHQQHTPTPAVGEQITSGQFNDNGEELDISHVDLCPGPELPCDDIGDYGAECDPCDDIGDYGAQCDVCDDIGDVGPDCLPCDDIGDYGAECDPCDDIGDYGPDCDPCDDVGEYRPDCDPCDDIGDYGAQCDVCDDIGDLGPDCLPCDNVGDLGPDCDPCDNVGDLGPDCDPCDNVGDPGPDCDPCDNVGDPGPACTTTTTTTVVATTTTVAATTTTAAPTTTTDVTTTTDAAQSPPPGGPTTTLLVVPTTGGQAPIDVPELPATGSGGTGRIVGAGVLLLAAGAAIVLITRRRPGRASDMI
jgi:hypothetical protein